MESRELLTTFPVINTNDSGAGSLRQAILSANSTPGADNIVFNIPASTSPNLDTPVSGFDPTTQTWKIALQTALPPLSDQVTIDGFTEGQTAIPFRYPSQVSQNLSISGAPTGGTFTLRTTLPIAVQTTAPIPFNANTAQVQAALTAIFGAGNIFVSGGPALPDTTINISFVGQYAGVSVPTLITDSTLLTGGTGPQAFVSKVVSAAPTLITSNTNGTPISAAIVGNNSSPRVVVDGSAIGGSPTGFEIDASHSIVRGLIVHGFGVGISVPNPGVVGALIQGNDIGKYRVFPVDPATGVTLTGQERVVGGGNTLQGVLLASTNATVGGLEPQDNNVIIGNGLQAVSILSGAQGNQVVGNQIGVVGPLTPGGPYFIVPNGAEGVRIAASSNYVGGPSPEAGNVIVGNGGDGVHIVGPEATRNNVRGNYIGVGPGGGFIFGGGHPGNLGDGVRIENAGDNLVGGPTSAYRNVISANAGVGVHVVTTPAVPTGAPVRNVLQNNYIGITADGISALGNQLEGVSIDSAQNVVGPGNVISANLRGVLLLGAGATGNLVRDNFIGTNGTGTADLGNAREGIRIDGASANSITGNAAGSQLISGNNVGLLILGPTAAPNVVLGNFVGSDVSGTADLGNSQEGIRVDNSPGNTIGGTTASVRNLISANHWGVVLTGAASLNNVLLGNLIGTDGSGTQALGNELDGVLINAGASGNQVGGPSALAGNRIAFNREDGVRVEDQSVRNAILTNSIAANLELGINLVPSVAPGPNLLQSAPVLNSIASGVGTTLIRGTLTSRPNTSYTIQFFFNDPVTPPTPVQGQRFVGQSTVVTDGNGVANFNSAVAAILNIGQTITATATDPAGNTSDFSAVAPPEATGVVQFATANFVVNENAGTATITVTRTGGSGGLFTVDYATTDGSAQAVSDYLPVRGTLTFNPGENSKSFTIPIVNDGLADADETVLLTLSNPTGPVNLGPQNTSVLTILGNPSPQTRTSFVVTNTNDSGPGSLRDAILLSNLPHTGADTIDFAIPASTTADLLTPVPGFDPVTQTWRISLITPLPAITHQVTIDGYTEGQSAIPFRYAAQAASQTITINGNPTGGTYTLTTGAPLPVGTTAPIAFNATSEDVRKALSPIVGATNVVALPGNTTTIAFTGQFAGLTIPLLTPTSSLTGGQMPTIILSPNLPGTPVGITSTANTTAARDGNNAVMRVIVDGSNIGGATPATGFELDASNSILRGLIVDGFGVGVSVPNPGVVGDLIQGNDIGKYRLFPVDPVSGQPLTGANQVTLAGQGNSLQGVLLGSTNATVGGLTPQANNVIIGNGQQGVSILSGAQGNHVVGNQIGVVGPSTSGGFYFIVPNGAEGVRIAASSNSVGGSAAGAGNLISGNAGDGVHIVGAEATFNNVQGNYIGVGPGGGFLFGAGHPGNLGDGVRIEDAGSNLVGGTSMTDRNVISANAGAGVRIFGNSGVRNLVQGNFIGLTSDGLSALGNSQEGVAIYSPLNVVGPGNVISANLRGVLLSGLGATGNQVLGNFIGTNAAGVADLGNAQEGIRIDGASANSITGTAAAPQLISGNNVGLLILGPTAVPNTVTGNFIGTDVSGTFALGNSQEGVRVENSAGNTIGGTTTTARNVIAANHWGVVFTGPAS